MKIWLLRHARAEAEAESGRDRDRRLLPEGRTASHALQDWIRDYRGPLPTHILVSPARRTLETATLCLNGLELPPITESTALWNASVGDLLHLIERNSSSPPGPMLLIGHNPGLEDLAVWLCGRIPHPGFKPGTLAIIDADTPLQAGQAVLEQFFQPSESR